MADWIPIIPCPARVLAVEITCRARRAGPAFSAVKPPPHRSWHGARFSESETRACRGIDRHIATRALEIVTLAVEGVSIRFTVSFHGPALRGPILAAQERTAARLPC